MTPGSWTLRPSTLSGTIGALLLAVAVAMVPASPASAAAPACPTVIAHRGNAYYGAPTENSVGAFNATFGTGAQWIETDVRFTSDAVPVLMHDSTVDRTTTGTGYVSTMTAAQFAALTMNDGQHAPTLDQALDLVRSDPDRRLVMEVKAITASQEPVLTEKLRGLENQVYVNAFAANLASIQRLKAANPLLQISYVGYAPILPVPAGISGEDLEYTYVTPEGVAALHAAGMTVRTWVANNPAAWGYLRDAGVDAVMTNSVSAYLAWAATACTSAPPDRTPPQVDLASPTAGGIVTDTIRVEGSASDDVAVSTVSLLVDGVAVASIAADEAVRFDWNSATVVNGTHTLSLLARDRAGNASESDAVAVDVQNVDDEDPTAPTDVTATWSAPNHVALTWSGSSDNGAVTGYRVYRDDEEIAQLAPSARSYDDAGVSNLTEYSYRVTALDAAGHESAPSEPGLVETGDDTAPTTPAATAAMAGTNAVRVSWSGTTDNAGVTGYRVYRDGALIETLDGAASSLLDSGLDDGVTYAFAVVALDAAGNASAMSTAVSVTTPDTTAPSAPGTLTAVSGNRTVALSWTAATDNVGVTKYVVHRNGAVLVTLTGSARSYTDPALDATTAHRYDVTAVDAAGLEGPASNVVTRSLADTTAPATPAGLTRTVSGFTVRLTWKASTDNVGVTGYTVYRAGVAIGTTTTALTYTDATAPPGKTYSYTVRARDAAGNLSASSTAVSAVLPVDRTAPTAPTGLRVTVGATGTRQLTLTWTASTDNAGVTSYYVYRGNAKYRLLGKVLTFTDTGLTAGTKYTYKVYALDATGNWSTPTGNVSGTAR